MDPSHCLYIFDRTRVAALLALWDVLSPLWGEEKTQEAIDRTAGRWLILSASVDNPRFLGCDDEQAVLQFVQSALEEIGAQPAGDGGLSLRWRIAPELETRLNALVAEHVRCHTTNVVSRSLQ